MKQPALVALLSATVVVSFLMPVGPLGAAPEDEKKKPAAEAGKKKEDDAKPRGRGEDKGGGKPAEESKPKAKPKKPPVASANLEVRVFEVEPSFYSVTSSSVPADPFAPDSSGTALRGKLSPREVLERLGVVFGPGASATYNRATYQLTVRNTDEQLDLIEAYVGHMDSQREKQLHVIVEYIEVEHAAFSDWLFENRLDTDGTPLRHWAQKQVKAGDGLIVESVMVTARSGQRAKTESILEFIYPTEYDPPEIPNEVELHGKAKAPISAVTPTAFETRNVGTTLEVDPVIGSDNVTVDLNLAPEIIALDGYAIWPNEELDEIFKQRMPIFYSMRISTQITLTDGNYAFLGTLRPQDAQLKGNEDPIVLGFVRADIGIVPLAKPRGK